jgi:hypothetical protein
MPVSNNLNIAIASSIIKTIQAGEDAAGARPGSKNKKNRHGFPCDGFNARDSRLKNYAAVYRYLLIFFVGVFSNSSG